MRPHKLSEYVGQSHLVGEGGVLKNMMDSGNVTSFILWGPPGVGKTTLAKILAESLHRDFYTLSAVSSGVKDVRDVIDRAQSRSVFSGGEPPILFIDEIHRFNKAQQDALLGAVEQGIFTLIGATTENPSFEVITPLLSRCQVFVLKSLEESDLKALLNRALTEDVLLKGRQISVSQTDALFRYSGGDGRKLLNILEIVVDSLGAKSDKIVIDDKSVAECLQQNIAIYDKSGEMHYDIISAFIKSIRGSDPDAAVYWLARMIAGGEDPEFIARRMSILACEDIGLANPNAMLVAETTYEIIRKIGMPEGRIPLSECAIYLANSAKSNSAYLAIDAALAEVRSSGDLPVPLHLRNAPTSLMKDMGYGHDYRYAHDYPGNFVAQQFRPDAIAGKRFWHPCANPAEETMRQRYISRWGTDPAADKG